MTIEQAEIAMHEHRKVANYRGEMLQDRGYIVAMDGEFAAVQWEFWGITWGCPVEMLQFEITVQ